MKRPVKSEEKRKLKKVPEESQRAELLEDFVTLL